MNVIDRAISAMSPKAGFRRLVDRRRIQILNSGYSGGGANTSKQWSKGWRSSSGSAREDISDNLYTLRQRCRDLYMNAPLGRAPISRIMINAIGTGLVLRPNPDADLLGLDRKTVSDWTRRVNREWALWAGTTSCDAAGLNTFAELQQVALLSWLQNGEAFALLPYIDRPGELYPMKVRLLEADRVCDPNTAGVQNLALGGATFNGRILDRGIEIGDDGQVLAYHVARWHPASMAPIGKSRNVWARIAPIGDTGRRNILHLVVHERAEQYHGVPFLAPVVEMLKQLDRYNEAELLAAVVAGMFTVFVKSTTPDNPLGETVPIEHQVDEDNPNTYELGGGAVIGLGENEDISVANPGRPNTAFEGFVRAVLQSIGAALNIPYEVMVNSYNSSYSASRAALLQAWAYFRMWRRWTADDFANPVYCEWLTDAILMGRIDAPGYFDDPVIRAAWQRADWHGPSAGQVDPVKEVTAAKVRVEEGFSTRERETAELTGMDWDSNMDRRFAEERRTNDLSARTPAAGGAGNG